jgi:glycosyltransferase involved in cell wall biosynthesis
MTAPLRAQPPASDLELSVVIPVFNEEAMLPELFRRLIGALEPLGLRYEVILVDDGSQDATPGMLRAQCTSHPAFRSLHFSRNFGHQAAVTAGIDHAAGRAIFILDADLQDPPELIGAFLAKWREGFEVVYGVRTRRKENALKRLAYYFFYRTLKNMTNVEIPLDAGDFALIDRRVADVLRAMPERNRFVRGIRSWAGFRQTGLVYEREKRFAGEVKYTFAKLVRLAFDGILGFSYVPLRLAIYLGLLVSGTSFALGVFFIFYQFFTGAAPHGWSSTIVTILFMGGIQLLTLGVIGEYVSRIYDEVKQRPLYIVRAREGFPWNPTIPEGVR